MNRQVSCHSFEGHLNAYLDSELDHETRARMIRHADQCPACGERLETMTRLLTMCAELDEGLAVPLDVQTAWRRAVREEAAHRMRPRRGGFARALGAVAAAVMLLAGGTLAYRIAELPPMEGTFSVNQSAQRYGAQPSGWDDYAYDMEEADTGAVGKSLVLQSDGPLAGMGGIVVADSEGELPGTTGAAPSAEAKKVVLRSAQRAFETTMFDQDMQAIDGLVSEYDGLLENQSVTGRPIESNQSQGRSAYLVARVPTESMDEFLSALDVVGTLISKDDQQEDISARYYDTATRLTSYRAQLKRYNELTSEAASMEDMLLLSDKVYEVQAQIDALERQIRGWDSYAQQSVVTISLTEVPVRTQVHETGTTFEERLRVAFYDSINWLNQFWQDAVVVLTFALPALVIVIPLIVVICVIVSAVKRRKRRGR